MESSAPSRVDEEESYQDAAIRKLCESTKAELLKSYTAVQDAYTISTPGESDRIPEMLEDLFKKSQTQRDCIE